MRAEIKGIKIFLENMEELEAVIERYGSDVVVGDEDSPPPKSARNRAPGIDNRDRVVLQTLVAAGAAGVSAIELGKMLGKRGRGLRGAAQRWALRIGLIADANVNPFENTRIGTIRALKIDAAHLAIAKGLI